MKNFDLKKFIAENKATFYSSLNEGNLGHNEIWSLEKEGPYHILTYTTIDGKKEKVFKSEEEAKTWIENNLNEGYNEFKRAEKGSKDVTAKDKGEEEVYGAGVEKGEEIEKKKLKESKLRSKIREMVLAEMENFNINDETSEYDFLAELEGMLDEKELNQKPSKKDKETEAADDVTVDDTEDVEIEDTEIDTSEVDPTVKAVQDALTQAQAASQKLGDEKLSNQIGNTITYFTRAHISKPNTLKELYDF